MLNWNEEQKEIIGFRGSNLLVSASAGSGKTTVMLERIRTIIIEERTPVKRMVILAFNEAVAAELKARLCEMLEDELINGEHGLATARFIEEQLDAIPEANISTIDAYCNRLIREYFDRLGLDPSAAVGEPADIENKLLASIERTIEREKRREESGIYGLRAKLGGDAALKDAIKTMYNYASTQADMEGWLDHAADIYLKTIDETGLVGRYTDMIFAYYGGFVDYLENLLISRRIDKAAAPQPYIVTELMNKIFAAESYAELHEITRADIPPQSYSMKALKTDKDTAKEIGAVTRRLIKYFESVKNAVEADADAALVLHRSGMADAAALIELTRRAAAEFRLEKERNNLISFNDMTYYASKLLREDETAREISARYDYVFVDEYQDQNYVNEYILNRISRNNLFMVGDVKQSIYRFRMAEPGIMTNKAARYESGAENSGKLIRLNVNYRSDKRILDAVNRVFSAIMTSAHGGIDYAHNERFTAHNEFPDNGVPAVNMCWFRSNAQSGRAEESAENLFNPLEPPMPLVNANAGEGEFIADLIEDLITREIYDAKSGAMRRVRFSDICLLSARRISPGNAAENAAAALRARGIPLDVSGAANSGSESDIETLINMLRVVNNRMDDIPLASAMLSVFGGFDEAELHEIVKNSDNNMPFWLKIINARKENDKIDRFMRLVDYAREMLETHSTADLMAWLFYDCGLENTLLSDPIRVRAVRRFIRYSEGFKGSLAEFLSEYSGAPPDAAEAETADNRFVKMMTIHKSKGLEFPIVILIDAANSRDNGRASAIIPSKDYGVMINAFDEDELVKEKSFAHRVIAMIDAEDSVNEKMRLLYVAMTRAKNHLFITGTVGRRDELCHTPESECRSFKDWLYNAVVSGALPSDICRIAESEEAAAHEIIERVPPDITELGPEMSDYLNYRYPHYKSTQVGLKHTVSEIVSENTYEDSFIVSGGEVEDTGVNRKRRGIDYHKILEHIDYGATTQEAVERELQRMTELHILDPDQLTVVDSGEILRIMNSDIIKLARVTPHLREQSFTMRVKAREFYDVDNDDEIIVQGAIDLVIMGDELIVVDFKKSAKSRSELIAAYSLQLELYARAAAESLGRKVARRLIYSIGTGEVINV